MSSQPVIKALLGPSQPGPMKRTPKGIAYFSNGFDERKPKKVKKAIAWLKKRNIPSYVIDEFEQYAEAFSDPAHIPTVLDAAFDEVTKLWLACGPQSKAAKVARSIDPHSITVTVEPCSFWVPNPGVYANGCAELDGKTIRMVVCAVHSISQPENASLATFEKLSMWEIGNCFSIRADYKVHSVADEIGNRSPCDKIH